MFGNQEHYENTLNGNKITDITNVLRIRCSCLSQSRNAIDIIEMVRKVTIQTNKAIFYFVVFALLFY